MHARIILGFDTVTLKLRLKFWFGGSIMLLSYDDLDKFIQEKESVLQIGAHNAEEHDELFKLGFKKFFYVEPLRENFLNLKKRFIHNDDVKIFNLAVTDIDGFRPLNKYYPTYVSSFFELSDSLMMQSEFSKVSTINVECLKLSSLLQLVEHEINLLIIDTQGSELEIINSGLASSYIPFVILELEYGDLYKKAPRAPVVIKSMEDMGYTLIQEAFDVSKLWSDGLFYKS